MTCTTNTVGISTYEFRYGGSLLDTSTTNTYLIKSATIDFNDGNYTCIAFIDIVPSNTSSSLLVQCEYTYIYCINLSWLFQKEYLDLEVGLPSILNVEMMVVL